MRRAKHEVRCPTSFAPRTSRFSLLGGARRRDPFVLPRHDPRPHRELVARQAQRLPGDVLAHARHLEEHAPRLDHCHPVVRRTLALAHARLRRLRGHRLVREDADPDLAAALDVVRDRAPRRLDLARVDPRRLERLQAELAEGDRRAGVGRAAPVPPVLLAELRSLWLEHFVLPPPPTPPPAYAGRGEPRPGWSLRIIP